MDDLSSNDSESQVFDKFTLKERNTILEQENLALKSQIDDAVNITHKLDLLQKQNLELSQEVINLKTANDNLHCRLQISLQTNSDLLKSIESQKVNYASQIQNDRLSAQNESTKQKEKYQAHIDQIYNELSQIKAQNDELQVNQKVFSNKIQHVLESADTYFNMKFLTLDDLITFLKQTNLPIVSNEEEQKVKTKHLGSEDVLQSSELVQLVKNLKRKLKSVKLEYQKTDKNYQELQATSKREISTLQRKLEFMQKEKSEIESNYESTIKDLNRQLNDLKENLENTKQQLKKSKQPQPVLTTSIKEPEQNIQTFLLPTENISDSPPRGKSDHLQIESLQARITDLTSQLNIYQNRQNELQDQNRKLESASRTAEINLTKVTNDLNSLQIVHKESLAEIESLRKSLHERQQTANKQKPVPIIIKDSPDKKLLARKEARISELMSDLHKKEQENDDLSMKLRDLELNIASKDDEINKIKQEYNEYFIRNESKKNVTADDLLPPGSFRYTNFDSSLVAEIDKIVSNESLQLPSKIEHCFRSIDDHYKKRLNEVQKLYQESVEESSELRNKMKTLITEVTIELTGKPYLFDPNKNNDSQITCSTVIESIQKVVSEFVNKYNLMSREKDQLQSVLCHLGTILETDDVIGKVDQIRDQLLVLSKRVLALKKKNKANCKENRELKGQLSSETSRLTSELDLCQTSCSELEKKITSQNDTIKKLRIQNRQLNNELKDAIEGKKELEATLTENAENQLGSLNSKYQQLENQYKSTINGHQHQILDLKDVNSSLENKIKQLEAQNKASLDKINSLMAEMDEIRNENEIQNQNLIQKFNTEKNSMKKSFDQAIDELKKKNEENREDIEEMSKCIASRDSTIDDLQKTIKILNVHKIKATNEAQSLREQIGREKKLAEATIKSQTCSIETKYKEKIETIKAQCTEEQHKMVHYVIDAFRTTFCGFIGKMEEKPFKILIDRIRDNYIKLQDSDQAIRRMLNVSERQTTQDAVAQLLINH